MTKHTLRKPCTMNELAICGKYFTESIPKSSTNPSHQLLSQNSSNAELISFLCVHFILYNFRDGFLGMIWFMNFRKKTLQSFVHSCLCTSFLSLTLNLGSFSYFDRLENARKVHQLKSFTVGVL